LDTAANLNRNDASTLDRCSIRIATTRQVTRNWIFIGTNLVLNEYRSETPIQCNSDSGITLY
jgi:hypothetical protein